MGRRVHPRHKASNGVEYLVLLSTNTGVRINNAKGLHAVHTLTAAWWQIETGRRLTIFPVGENYVWCVPDVLENQLNYKWLSRKAARYEQKIVDYLNKQALPEQTAPVGGA